MALDLGQADVDAPLGSRGRGAEQLGQVGQAVADGVEHGRLKADGVAQGVEGVQQPANGRLAPAGQRPLEILALELLGRGVVGTVVLGRLQQPPLHQGA